MSGEVVGTGAGGPQVVSVVAGRWRTIPCGLVVNAAGPWARRRWHGRGRSSGRGAAASVFVFEARSDLHPAARPLVIDTSGAWFRPDGGSFIAGIAPPGEDLADLPLEVDRDEFESALWPALAARVPAFDAIRVTNAWAGYYEMNTFDHNAIIGPHPEVMNLLFANGFSGHGIQQAPAVGRALAELIVHGRYVTLDLSIFGFERIAAGHPVIERNVIG